MDKNILNTSHERAISRDIPRNLVFESPTADAQKVAIDRCLPSCQDSATSFKKATITESAVSVSQTFERSSDEAVRFLLQDTHRLSASRSLARVAPTNFF